MAYTLEPLQLLWQQCQGDRWCQLNTVNLEHTHFDSLDGVYVIWHGGNKPATVRVGQGAIRDRLAAHRADPEVQAFRALTLYATWARVPAFKKDGVERFLYERLRPKVGSRCPAEAPIRVNLPW